MTVAPPLPQLRTERTIVRLAESKDAGAVLDFYSRNRERLTALTPEWPEGFFTAKFWQAQVSRNLDEFYLDQSARMFAFLPDEKRRYCVGTVSLSAILRGGAQFCFLGYNIDGEYEGKGYAFEMVSAAVQFGFDELNLHRIMANYIPTNERSGNLLKRLGFTVDGYARDYLRLNGKWQDHLMTSITNPNWKPQLSR